MIDKTTRPNYTELAIFGVIPEASITIRHERCENGGTTNNSKDVENWIHLANPAWSCPGTQETTQRKMQSQVLVYNSSGAKTQAAHKIVGRLSLVEINKR